MASRIETEQHRRDYAFRAAEQWLIAAGEETPDAGPAREALVDEYLASHPECVVGAALEAL